jgi:hypothetical protein
LEFGAKNSESSFDVIRIGCDVRTIVAIGSIQIGIAT